MKALERAKEELNKLVELFESGNIPEAIRTVVLTSDNIPSAKWSLLNRLLAFLQTGEIDCRTYLQWKNVNRQVKAGMKASYIFRPHTIRKANELTKEDEIVLVGFGTLPVFSFSSTEGEPIPELMPPEPPPLIEVAEKLGLQVEYQVYSGFYLGKYRPDTDHITLSSHDERVFFHELAHAAHKRVIQNLKIGQDPFQEIVAELAACTLARIYGCLIPNEGSTYRYICKYAEEMKRTVSSAIVTTLAEVQQVLFYIIEQKENAVMAGHTDE